MTNALTLFAGTANPSLAKAVAHALGVELGVCTVERFPDGELAVHLEQSVRNREVFIVQPTSPPVNEHLVELLTLSDACRRAAAARITERQQRAELRRGARVSRPHLCARRLPPQGSIHHPGENTRGYKLSL